MDDYKEFIEQKNHIIESVGFDVVPEKLNNSLFGFQKDIVRWALGKGRACVFADCGLGKTLMQLEWSYQLHKRTGGDILILAPLSVTEQTAMESEKFSIPITVCADQSEVQPGINITNYEKLSKFIANKFVGVVLDESSILKSFVGKVKNQIIDSFSKTKYRLACTATPAPNDYMELGNHSEFLGIMTRVEMLSMYFVHDSGQTSKWRLKRHAESVFWQWMASWAVFIENPSNLGYPVTGYELPELNIHEIIVDGVSPFTGQLTLTQRRQARKDSLELRCQATANLVNSNNEQWLVWCELNIESQRLWELCEDSFQIRGSDKPKYKSEIMSDFKADLVKCLITKPSIAGFGMNWQNCHNIIFVGLGDSYEKYYQAIRRCWRFGQEMEVNVYIIISTQEGCIKDNIERKRIDAEKMKKEMITLTKEITQKELKRTCRITSPYLPRTAMELPDWEEFIS